jgi:hypothetical protein
VWLGQFVKLITLLYQSVGLVSGLVGATGVTAATAVIMQRDNMQRAPESPGLGETIQTVTDSHCHHSI